MLVIIALFGLRLVPLLATGVGGGIVGLLWDRDKSQGAGKGIYWYLWGVRKVFWFYAVLGALPILVSFEHSPQSYLGFVLVQTVVLAAQKDITGRCGSVAHSTDLRRRSDLALSLGNVSTVCEGRLLCSQQRHLHNGG